MCYNVYKGYGGKRKLFIKQEYYIFDTKGSMCKKDQNDIKFQYYPVGREEDVVKNPDWPYYFEFKRKILVADF